MEELLHYTWRHKLFPSRPLATTEGKVVEVIDPGLPNYNAGPDFFNAKIKIDGTLWVGNVEIHDKSSDWFFHGHDTDERYDNVVLHVASVIDKPVKTSKGLCPPQLQMDVPMQVKQHYKELLATDKYPPCYQIIPHLSRLTVHSWMSALQTERLEQKTEAILKRITDSDGSWEAGYFVTLARNFGFGINGDAFEEWAKTIPLHAVDHHRDNLFQIEAIFLGQAGLLNDELIPQRYRDDALKDEYYHKLRDEYFFLSYKFSLHPINGKLWRFLRLHPQNFPPIRLSQMANLYYHRKASLSQLVDCKTVKEVRQLLSTHPSDYWQTHYMFGNSSEKKEKSLSSSTLNLLIVNTVAPMLFAYGRHKADEQLCQRAFDFLEEMPAENNYIVRMWKEVGLSVDNAVDSQALIQLKKQYCDRKDCLRCRIGYEYLKRK